MAPSGSEPAGNILKNFRENAPECFAPMSASSCLHPCASTGKRFAIGRVPEPPFIVRPVDSHAGHGLAKRSTLSMRIPGYLENATDMEFFISPFFDYEVTMACTGNIASFSLAVCPMPAILGISENWMIHYLNAGMTESPWKREEEARFNG